MPMVAHDAVRNYSHRALAFRPRDEMKKIFVFCGSLKEKSLVVPSIDAVHDATGWQIS